MSETMRERCAREICSYPSGPSDFNSCCPEPMGQKRCQRQVDAILDTLMTRSHGLITIWLQHIKDGGHCD